MACTTCVCSSRQPAPRLLCTWPQLRSSITPLSTELREPPTLPATRLSCGGGPLRQQRRRPLALQPAAGKKQEPGLIQNTELLIGDCLCLLCFALYKQIAALILQPAFPGWLEPLHFNPLAFLEFISFTVTLGGTWVASGILTGGYRTAATADMQTALSRTCLIWLIAMPVAAAQLVLLTAAEGGSLVGEADFASRVLPVAASGPGEPFVTAAGVLGLMSVWRSFYAAYLDIWGFRSASGSRIDRQRQIEHFVDAGRGALLLSLACCAVLQVLGGAVGEEGLEAAAGSLLAHLAGGQHSAAAPLAGALR